MISPLMHSGLPARLLRCLLAAACLAGITGCFPVTSPEQPAAATPASQAVNTDITITLGGATPSLIRPLLGVNIGPLPAGSDPANADLTSVYKQVGVNLIRTHDYYNALDMSIIYPGRTADPSKLTSYNFTSSDLTWKSIINGGFEPYFRLGDSYNDAVPPANALERANWVKAAIEVLRHYRAGKWNGFHTPFRYVEVWNEPDNQQFWPRPRTAVEYYQLYIETAQAVKQEFPDLKVGGPGVTPAGALTPQGQKWVQNFMDFIRQNNRPLDFFSWHMYSNSPSEYAQAAASYRAALDARGFTQTPTHITEWNTDIKHGSDSGPEARALRCGSKGAALLTAAWIELQQNNIEVSTFYRGPDPDIRAATFYGMFYADGRPKPIALAFSLWSKMSQYSGRLNLTNSSSAQLWLLAGQNGSVQSALLIANPSDTPHAAAIAFSDQRKINSITLYRVDETALNGQVQVSTLNSPVVDIGANTVELLIFN